MGQRLTTSSYDFIEGRAKRTRWGFRSNHKRQRGCNIDRMHQACDTLCGNSQAGKDDWHVGIVPPWRSMSGSNLEFTELIDEAVWLEHYVYVAGAIGIVIPQDRLHERRVRDLADIERAA